MIKYLQKIKINQKGMSLAELLLYVALMAMILTAIASFSLNIHGSYMKNYIAGQVHDNLRTAMYYLTTRIKLSNGINVSASTLNSNPGVLVLKTFDLSTNPIVFSLNGANGIIYLSEGASSPLPITNDEVQFTKFIFTKMNNQGRDSVGIVLEASRIGDTVEDNYNEEIKTAVSLRY